MGQSRPLFVYFRYFLITISIIQIEKSVDGVLGIQTLGRRMVGADKTTELWRPPFFSGKKCILMALDVRKYTRAEIVKQTKMVKDDGRVGDDFTQEL